MSNQLNPSQFGPLFHGTIHPLDGDRLLPAKHWGATTAYQDPHAHLGQSRHEWVSATDDEGRAWSFAYNASGQHAGLTQPRVRVHEVEPNEHTRIGVEHVDHPALQEAFANDQWNRPQPAGEHVAPYFKVKRTHDIKPGHQGTFPEVNWHEFSKPTRHGDPNHPSDPPKPPSRARQAYEGAKIARDINDQIAQNQGKLF